jgi:hypothetical protein
MADTEKSGNPHRPSRLTGARRRSSACGGMLFEQTEIAFLN